MKRIIGILLLGLAIVMTGCKKTDDPLTEEREFTAEEEVKRHLDDTFSTFVEKLQSLSPDEASLARDIIQCSHISLRDFRYVVYSFEKDGTVLISAQFRPGLLSWDMKMTLYGGLQVIGTVNLTPSLKWEDWEKNWDLDVYDQGVAVAKLGIERYEDSPIFVFRFPDGTSYAVDTLLIVQPLVEYLIENVLSAR